MKKILFTLGMLAAFGGALEAQQEHHYTQFVYNKLPINPAYAGVRGVPSVTLIYRNQWLGFDGAPKSMLASVNMPFLTPRVGLGITLSSNQIGLQRDYAASMAYSYDVIGEENVSLRVGIMGSIRNLGMDFTKAEVINLGDPSFDSKRINDFYANVGAGIYATFSQRIYVGFSVPRIYSNNIGINDLPDIITSAKEYRHFYGMAGAILPLSEDINLMPAVLLKYVQNAPFDADINLNLDIKEKVTAGISGRIGGDGGMESVSLLAFWQFSPQVGVGAAYDFTLSRLRDYNAGSFEVLLQADLKSKKKNLSNPRFFM